MPSPKDIKKLMNAAKGVKSASKAVDLDEVMGRLPKVEPALQAKIDAELNEIRRRQKAAYDVPQLPKEKGKKALAEARRILALKEAPAVIVPSKLSNLEKAIRESKGEFGAKRVQRAADEIKNLEDLYTEQALREAFGGDNAKALMVMNPNDFQGFAHPLEMSERRIAGHDPSKATMPTSEYIRHLSGISEFHDVPFLQINKEEQGLPLIPFITGHEGRHRNRAMVERGDPAGLVQLLPRAELREPFPRRDQEEYLEALRKELEMTDNLVIPEKYLAPSDKSSFGDWIYRPAVKLPKLFAEGGLAMAGGGGKLGKALKAARGAEKAVESGKDLQSMVEAARPLTAAERAMAGKLMTEYIAAQPVTRLSEALGNVGAEGKKLRITQSDRTAAKYLGGPPFSGLQLVDPNYAEARATWGVKTPTAAKIITNQTSPDILWSTLIGSPFQHRSNELIFDKLYKAFQKSAKEGNLSEELRAKFNAALEPHFGEGADILDPKLRKEINTFEERGIVGNLLLGKELGGALRGGSIIPGGKIMMESTEPMLQGVKTFSVGPRLFTLDKGVISRPDMHPAFPEIMQGEDLRQLFTPVPNEIALPTFHEEFRRRTGRKKKPGYYELTMTPEGDPYPTQDVTEEYLTHLQREGYADGGGVHMQGGGNPGDVSGEMFKPKPLEIPSIFKDAAAALKAQFEKERRSMRKPGAVQDVIMRGPVAFGMGAPMDIVGMGGELLDYAQTKIPALRKPASVMDTGPEKTPPMGYAPRVSLAPEGPYGTEAAQELLGKAGLTTGEERPLFELGAGVTSPAVVTGGYKLGKALAPTAREMLEAGFEKAMSPYQMNIIKSEGGNWVQGAAENYLKGLKYLDEVDPIGVMSDADKAAEQARVNAMNNFVDKKLTRYFKNEMATPSDSLRLQADVWVEKQKTLLADKQKQIDKVRADIAKAQRERNVDPEVLTRSQARLRELQKEKEFIQNRKGLHFDPAGIDSVSFEAASRRQKFGAPKERAAQSDIGQRWEDISDLAIYQQPYMDQPQIGIAKTYAELKSAAEGTNLADKATLDAVNRELEKMGGKFALENPEAMAYRTSSRSDYVGFNHLMDELDNALRPAQGLPEHLQLSPKTLDKMSVAQAAEHVDKINAWRASQKAEVDKTRAANAATVVHKEYPEQGLKWVELKVPEMLEDFKVPERYEIRKPTPSSETFAIWDKEKQGYITTGLGTEEAAVKHLHKTLNQEALQDALKYEGEILQHCVGGYCPDVMEGRSRIFSLRDENGRPHATIEVEPEPRIGFRQGEGPKTPDEDYALRNQYVAGVNNGTISNDMTFAEWWRSTNNIPEPVRTERISQIKGLQNKKPQAEFIPYIQDFVKGGTWSRIGDLEHTELASSVKTPWRQKFEEAGIEVPDLFSPKDYEDMVRQYFEKTSTPVDPKFMHETYGFPLKATGGAVTMAEGGAVDYESRFNEMLQNHIGMAEGGAVNYESRFNQMLQQHVGMADGGEVNQYNSDPDMSDGGLFVAAPAFKNGGAVKSIWTVN